MRKSDAGANSYRLSGATLTIRLHPSAITLPNNLEIAMNRTRTIAIVTAASLVFGGAAQAATNKMLDQMMDNCIQQFVASNLAGYEGKITVEKSDGSYHGPSLMAGSGSYEIKVAAIGRPGSSQLATATCQMARDGRVVSLKSSSTAAITKVQVEPVVVATN
jgi:hypothetical protein